MQICLRSGTPVTINLFIIENFYFYFERKKGKIHNHLFGCMLGFKILNDNPTSLLYSFLMNLFIFQNQIPTLFNFQSFKLERSQKIDKKNFISKFSSKKK